MDEFRDMVNSARKVFSDLPPIPEGIVLHQGVWDEREVDLYMKAKHGVRFVVSDNEAFDEGEQSQQVEEEESIGSSA